MSHDPTPHPTTPIAIVGGGPVGLALALGLARHGVRSVLVEREETTSEHSRAPGIHIRTREVLRLWGVEADFVEAGVLTRTLTLHAPDPDRGPHLSLDFAELAPEADRPGLLLLEQAHTERLLLEAVRESGLCDVRFATEATALERTPDGAVLTLRHRGEERPLHASFVVGCDGAGSFVREALGLSFDGITYSVRPVLADVRIRDGRDALPWPRMRNGRDGITTAIRLSDGLWRMIRLERGEPRPGDEVSDAEVGRYVSEALGEGPFETVWASRFRIHRRAAPRFRVGRVLLAGDAAHVHSPVGGLGMNGGIHDAHNLAWKLAAALDGGDTERLLDSYDVERRAVMVENVSRYTDRITRTFLDSPSRVRGAAFFLLRLLMRNPTLRRMNLRRMTMLDLEYPSESPLLVGGDRAAGVRLPNPPLRAPDGAEVRLYDLLPNAPVVLELAEGRDVQVRLPVETVIRIGPGGYREPAGVLRRLLGAEEGWILVRPDAHVAWARDRPEGMDAAVRHALGMPRPGRETARAGA
jgi:2-polyprenyl-6-methoxyphenol hydroxylase-like FAD-dependent oxidoreductase